MTKDEAIECAKNMTYQEAIRNTIYAKGVRYKKATRIKLQELAEIADKIDTAEPSKSVKYKSNLLDTTDRPTVIRSKTLMPTKDFKEWAKRIREVNPNAVVIPCDAEVMSADRPTIKQTDTLIIADALRYLVQDTERHESDRTRAEELRKQILQYGASMCHSADRPKGEWIEVFDFVHLAWECSKCGAITSVMTPFCYECGSDMRKDQDR